MHERCSWALVTNFIKRTVTLLEKKKKYVSIEFPRARLFNGNVFLLEYHNEKYLG